MSQLQNWEELEANARREYARVFKPMCLESKRFYLRWGPFKTKHFTYLLERNGVSIDDDFFITLIYEVLRGDVRRIEEMNGKADMLCSSNLQLIIFDVRHRSIRQVVSNVCKLVLLHSPNTE
jgi:hypothetical protein